MPNRNSTNATPFTRGLWYTAIPDITSRIIKHNTTIKKGTCKERRKTLSNKIHDHSNKHLIIIIIEK